MKGTRIQIGAVLLAVIMTVSVIGIGMAPVGAGLTGSGDGDAQVLDTEIDDALLDADDTVEVIVHLDDVEEELIRTQGVDALQDHAEATQDDLTSFADDEDGLEVVNEFWITNAVILEVDTDEFDVEELAEIEGVEELTENFEVQLPDQPETSDEDITTQDTTYGLDQINVPEAWDQFGVDGDGATISVLDTGIDGDHPDLGALTGFAEFDDNGNVISEDPRESDDRSSHGTHVSGTVAGGDASGTAIGVAPGVDLLNGLVLDGGSGSAGAILGGMEWSVDNDADVISMSLGGDGYSDFWIDPIQNAQDAGTMVISASGNSGPGTSGSPANVYDGMAIGATDANEQVTSFSSGETIDTESAWGGSADSHWPAQYIVPDVSAPGADVESATQGGGYASLSGTSMATPHVSGVVGLMISAAADQGMEFGVDYDISDVEDALEETAWKPSGEQDGQDDRYGYGIVDTVAAIEQIVDDEPSPPEPGDGVEFDLHDGQGEVGDTVSLDLTAHGEEFAGYETVIAYDDDVVELVAVEGVDMDDPVTDMDDGVVSMSQVAASADSDLTVAELTFELLDEGDSSVEFVVEDTDASDEMGTLLDVETDDGHITVEEEDDDFLRGDVLDDGQVTIADGTVTGQYAVGNDVPPEFHEDRADLTGDGDVTAADVIEILEIVTDLDG